MSIEINDVLEGNETALAYIRSEIINYRKSVEEFNEKAKNLDIELSMHEEGKQVGYVTLCKKLESLVTNVQKEIENHE
jgi:hypothetical protein